MPETDVLLIRLLSKSPSKMQKYKTNGMRPNMAYIDNTFSPSRDILKLWCAAFLNVAF